MGENISEEPPPPLSVQDALMMNRFEGSEHGYTIDNPPHVRGGNRGQGKTKDGQVAGARVWGSPQVNKRIPERTK
jgi:hypothetical protein